jgi:hypothetical protein
MNAFLFLVFHFYVSCLSFSSFFPCNLWDLFKFVLYAPNSVLFYFELSILKDIFQGLKVSRILIIFMYTRVSQFFHHYDKIPNTNNLKEERLILAHNF